MARHGQRWGWCALPSWLCVLVVACATPSPVAQQEDASHGSEAEWVDGRPVSERSIDCLSLICDGQFCWGVRCEDAEAEGAHAGHFVQTRGTLTRPGPAASRHWGGAH